MIIQAKGQQTFIMVRIHKSDQINKGIEIKSLQIDRRHYYQYYA